MGLLVLLKDFRTPTNQYFFALCSSIFIWLLATAIAYLSTNEHVATIWFKIDNFGVMFISPSFYAFSAALVGEKRKTSITFGYLVAFFFGSIGLTNSYFIDSSKQFYWGYFPQWKILNSVPFFLFWFGYSIASFRILISASKASTSGYAKNQIKFVMLAFMFAYLGSIDYLATSGIEVYPLGFIPIFLLISIIFYAIIKHKLMDFNLIVRWGLAYASTIVTISIVSFLGIYVIEKFFTEKFHISLGLSSLVIICAIVLIFDPLKRGISKHVDRIIFKSPDFQSIILGFTSQISTYTKLEDLLNDFSTHLRKTWGISHAGFLIWDHSLAQFKCLPETTFEGLPILKFLSRVGKNDFLIKTLETERRLFKYGIVVKDEITALGNGAFPGEKITFSKIQRTMSWLGASACIPLMRADQLQGIIILGPKKNNSFYNEEDKKFLSHVANLISDQVVNKINLETGFIENAKVIKNAHVSS